MKKKSTTEINQSLLQESEMEDYKDLLREITPEELHEAFQSLTQEEAQEFVQDGIQQGTEEVSRRLGRSPSAAASWPQTEALVESILSFLFEELAMGTGSLGGKEVALPSGIVRLPESDLTVADLLRCEITRDGLLNRLLRHELSAQKAQPAPVAGEGASNAVQEDNSQPIDPSDTRGAK